MKYAIMTASVEGTRVNASLLDDMISKLMLVCLDRNHRQVCMRSYFEQGLYTVTVFTSAFHKESTPIALKRILKSLVAWDKADPTFFVDYSTGGPMLISPVEEFIEVLEIEHGVVILPEDLE